MGVRTRRGSVSSYLVQCTIDTDHHLLHWQRTCKAAKGCFKKKTRSTDAADGCFRRFADFVLVWYIAWHQMFSNDSLPYLRLGRHVSLPASTEYYDVHFLFIFFILFYFLSKCPYDSRLLLSACGGVINSRWAAAARVMTRLAAPTRRLTGRRAPVPCRQDQTPLLQDFAAVRLRFQPRFCQRKGSCYFSPAFSPPPSSPGLSQSFLLNHENGKHVRGTFPPPKVFTKVAGKCQVITRGLGGEGE